MATGIVTVKDNSASVLKEIGTLTGDALRDFSLDSVKEIKAIAPVDTGHHRGSIREEGIGTGLLTRAVFSSSNTKTGNSYGAYLEYGTKRQSAQPHFTPGLLKTIDKYQRRGIWG
jgi:hypothetical protein